ncbi:MAG: hypothetical protein AAB338_01665 [Patescibacteria group bacterium]
MEIVKNSRLTRLTELLPVFVANYAKRFAEGAYDDAFRTRLGQSLLGMNKSKKYGIEFILNVLTAFFELRLAENSSLQKFLKEVGIDAAPEVSKRLHNGIREEIRTSVRSFEEKRLADVILGLDNRDLIDLLDWLFGKRMSEKMAITKKISCLSAEQLTKVLRLSPKQREEFFDLLNPQEKTQGEKKVEVLLPKWTRRATDEIKGWRATINSWSQKAGSG